MTRSEACAIIVRRLGLNAGRVAALAQRVAEGGLLPKARGRDVPELSSLDLAHLLLAIVADRGIGVAGQSVREFAALQSIEGLVLVDLIEAMICGRANVSGLQSVVVQPAPAGVSITAGCSYFRFGAEHAGGAAKQIMIRGDDLAAAILEFRGLSQSEANETVAVGRLAAALN